MAGYSQQIIQCALNMQAKYGVPASTCLGQYALESGWGTSFLSKYHNYFGLSGKSEYGRVWRSDRYWQVFPDMQTGFYAYGKLLSKPLYANKTKGAKNITQYVNAFVPTYAPASDGNYGYATKLLNLIKKYNLTQYDTVFGGSGVSNVGTTTDTPKVIKFELVGEAAEIHVWNAQSPSSISKWGLLRYFQSVSLPSYGKDKAGKLLELYNRKSRTLVVNGAYGHPQVRAGTIIPVKLDLGDFQAQHNFLVSKAVHRFSNDKYTMDITLEGAYDE